MTVEAYGGYSLTPQVTRKQSLAINLKAGPNDSLPSPSCHLLKFHNLPKQYHYHPLETRYSNISTYWDILHANHNLLLAPIGSRPSHNAKCVQSKFKTLHSLTVPTLLESSKSLRDSRQTPSCESVLKNCYIFSMYIRGGSQNITRKDKQDQNLVGQAQTPATPCLASWLMVESSGF